MSERQTLTAFCVLISAICYLATVAAVLAWSGKYVEALGFGGLTTGLVGVLGSFRPKNLLLSRRYRHPPTVDINANKDLNHDG